MFILGDSLSVGPASPGGQLAEHLRQAGATVTVNAKVGRSALSFFKQEDGAGQIADAAADMSIVFLGTNSIGVADDEHYKTLLDQLPGQVWAIGPPRMVDPELDQKAAAVTERLKAIFPRFVDARSLTPRTGRAPDGVHFAPSGAGTLGARLARAFLGGGGVGRAIVLGLIAGAAVWWLTRG